MTDPTASAGAAALPKLKSSQAAIDLIVMEEVSSEAAYQKLYQHPEWPGGASGVTIRIAGMPPLRSLQGIGATSFPSPW